MKVTIKSVLISSLLLFVFIFFSEIISMPFILLNINTNNISNIYLNAYIILAQIILIVVIFSIYKKDYKQNWSKFKSKYNSYFIKYAKYWLIGVLVMASSNLILKLIFDSIANNEEAIRSTFSTNPFYIYVSAVFLAPILEESIFRLNMKKMFESKWVYILFSGIIFGACHVVGSITSWYDIFYIIPYSALGIAFAKIMYDSDNIFISTLFHFLHNGILISLQFLMLFLG